MSFLRRQFVFIKIPGDFLVVQWLKTPPVNAGAMGSVPGQSPVRELRPPPAVRQPSPPAATTEARGLQPVSATGETGALQLRSNPAPAATGRALSTATKSHAPKNRKKRKKQLLRKMADFVKPKVYLPRIQPPPGTCPRDAKFGCLHRHWYKRSQMLCS